MAELDQLLVDPTRLAIMALLSAAEWAEFGFVRDSVRLSDSALSKQVSTLSKNDYVDVRKGYVGKRPRTWLNLTDIGRDTLAAHLSALQDIAAKARSDGARQASD
ncbi:winged helix-turn-helix domain-containing protein [Amycolatopsis echigonensis]|uniref:DNA-binding MarR family transcriptional regulator n=2 Tax=Amycolatopsis echigonensis TaxID=2576905 RepID=A0A2N3WR93_9PSEU|nr:MULTISPECIES: transcriptional regulator [Amycolatopsis]PKV96396.1 DNA-binding MarR family transcriptional regulator [Amycolatopsis niigatensis]